MGTAKTQGDLWGQAPHQWATLQEPNNKPLFKAMLDAAGVGQDTRFLDAGCGTGGACIMATERGAHVSGIDAAEEMIAYARRRVPQGDFRVGDLESLPFDDNAYSVVFAANSVQFTADRIKALHEFGRICHPGGRVVAGLFGPPEKVAYRSLFEAVAKVLPNPPPSAGPFELSMPGKLEALFEEAGLKVAEVGEVNCPFYFADSESYWQGVLSAGPIRRAVRQVGEKTLKSAILEAAEPFLQNDGSILFQPNLFKFVAAEC